MGNSLIILGILQDFCYYANTIFIVMLLFYPRNEKLFLVCFSFAEVSTLFIHFCLYMIEFAVYFSHLTSGSMQGPLAWALIVWRCSLVFSSFDKIVSVLIHLLPGESDCPLCDASAVVRSNIGKSIPVYFSVWWPPLGNNSDFLLAIFHLISGMLAQLIVVII